MRTALLSALIVALASLYLSWDKGPRSAASCVRYYEASLRHSYWNVCDFPVNMHFCGEADAAGRVSTRPTCERRHLRPGEIATTFRGAPRRLAQVSPAEAESVDGLRACEAPLRPRMLDRRAFVCE